MTSLKTLHEQKIIPTDQPIHELIQRRWSPRSFTDQPISTEDLQTILEAASLAFSASNTQPWQYVYAHNGTPGFEQLWGILAPGNQPWAKNAAVLMVSFAKKVNDKGASMQWSQHDLGAANATLVLQALSMEIYAHLMAGFDAVAANNVTGLSSEIWQPIAMIALGYPGSPENLPEPYLSREITGRVRKSLSEFTSQI